ncbi:PREDICTED: zinc carboxypeptidase-like [Nicrophorus vespilloides]|uniref:Zinc carboxypeptidase-like n=1 Tax=Nicrophorus vespilloides TaxID=110193 RepID=A0ABM1M5K6_NICVS|nr:PREDICTED: zinc carboxypeptidase-like [Nicrophorus vespilloides]
MKAILATCLVLAVAVFGEKVRYDGFQVYELIPVNEQQVSALKSMEELNGGYSFWIGASTVGKAVHVMVPPHLKLNFEDSMKLLNLNHSIYMENVQEKIESSSVRTHYKSFGWTQYHTLEEIYDFLRDLESRFPDNVKVVKGGESYEGRDILGVHVSFNKANENNAIFIEGGIHAREWIGPATVTYMLNEFMTSTDSRVRNIAESHDWYIFPSVNPDGYVYTHARDRMWRKTRQPYGFCVGADPNRNWGFHWMEGGASNNPCLETFAGSKAFSEPETKSLADYIESINKKLVGYIAFHSYSQLLLIPYGHTSQHLENYDELYRIGLKGAKALEKHYGTKYTVGNIVETIYIASGGSMDWVKGEFGTRITYTYELRDTGRHGFLLPAEQIIPTGEETLDSLVTMLEEYQK